MMERRDFWRLGWLLAIGGAGATLVFSAPAAASRAADWSAIWPAMPGNAPGGEIRLEAALVIRDLREYRQLLIHQQEMLKATRLGAEYYASGADRALLGFDAVRELSRVLDLAQPDGQPTPAGLVAFTGAQGMGFQLLIRVAPGLETRLRDLSAPDDPAPWSMTHDGQAFRVPVGEHGLVGRVDEGGWLRLSPAAWMLVPAGEQTVFQGTMGKWTNDLDGALFLQGGGELVHAITRALDDPRLSEVVSSARGAVVGWRRDSDGTTVTRLLVDLPLLERFGPLVRSPDLVNRLTGVWDEKTDRFVSLSLPPVATSALLPLVERQLELERISFPAALRTAIPEMDGRIGWVHFGSPDDWALGIGFRGPQAAQQAVPALKEVLAQLMIQQGLDPTVLVTEKMEGRAEPVLHLRPQSGLEGWRIAAVDSTVLVVRQKARLRALDARQQSGAGAGADPGDDRPRVAGPTTPTVVRTLAEPAMLLGYLVLGDDGSWVEYLSWIGPALRQLWRARSADLPLGEWVERCLDQVPMVLTLQGVATALLYDVALWGDVQDSVLVLQLLASEI